MNPEKNNAKEIKCGEEDMPMSQCQTISSPSQLHVITVDGATYEVISNYKGDISLFDLFKQMIKRDMERQGK